VTDKYIRIAWTLPALVRLPFHLRPDHFNDDNEALLSCDFWRSDTAASFDTPGDTVSRLYRIHSHPRCQTLWIFTSIHLPQPADRCCRCADRRIHLGHTASDGAHTCRQLSRPHHLDQAPSEVRHDGLTHCIVGSPDRLVSSGGEAGPDPSRQLSLGNRSHPATSWSPSSARGVATYGMRSSYKS
jgi:hypothetical protein